MIFPKTKTIILNLIGRCICDQQSKVIFYHDVYSDKKYTNMGTPLSLFKKHIEVIHNENFEIVTHISCAQKQVQICFDDGFRGIFDIREYFAYKKIYPTVFISVDLIGKDGYLTKDQIIELQSLGFNFQSHAWSHTNLTRFNDDELKKELKGSKDFLSELLGKEITEICFPIGYFSDKVHTQCLEYGYKKMYTSIPGSINDNVGEGLVTRNLVQFYSPSTVKAVLHGALFPFRQRYLTRQYIK